MVKVLAASVTEHLGPAADSTDLQWLFLQRMAMGIDSIVKRFLAVSMVLCLAFSCFAADGYLATAQDDELKVLLKGTIGAESLSVLVLNADTKDQASVISFSDLSPLNTAGFIVSDEVYSLVYSFISDTSKRSMKVSVKASSLGLTSDGGRTYPISISFVDSESSEDEIAWAQKNINVSGTAEYEEYQSFRIRLDRVVPGASVKAGHYTGTINFQLSSD